MASPQPDKFIKISTELFEALMKEEFNSGETKVISAIMRETYGYYRKIAQISKRRFRQLTNIPTTTLKRSIKSLHKRRIIQVWGSHKWTYLKKWEGGLNNGPPGASIFGIQKNYDEWQGGPKMAPVQKRPRPNNGPPLIDTNKEIDKERKNPPKTTSPGGNSKKKKAAPPRPLKKWDSKKFFEEFDPLAKKVKGMIGITGNDKFPYNWAAQKIKKGWDPEIIVQVTEEIISCGLKDIEKPFAYFDKVWKTRAQNLRAARVEREHERYKEDMKNGVEKLAGKVFKDL